MAEITEILNSHRLRRLHRSLLHSSISAISVGQLYYLWELEDFHQELGADLHVGAAQLGDADTDVAGFVTTETDNSTSDVITPAEDTDLFTDGEARRGELHAVLTVGQHRHQHLHLCVGNRRQTVSAELIRIRRLVGQEEMDLGEFDNLQSFLLRDSDKDILGDNWLLDLLATTVFPDMQLPLGGGKGFIAFFKEFVADGFLGTCADKGDVPAFFGVAGYAYGIVSDIRWRDLCARR